MISGHDRVTFKSARKNACEARMPPATTWRGEMMARGKRRTRDALEMGSDAYPKV